MSSWLNSATTILETIVNYFPSPKESMQFKAEFLYHGPYTDEVCLSMK